MMAVAGSTFESSFDSWKSGEMPNRSVGDSTMMTGFYMFNNPRDYFLQSVLPSYRDFFQMRRRREPVEVGGETSGLAS